MNDLEFFRTLVVGAFSFGGAWMGMRVRILMMENAIRDHKKDHADQLSTVRADVARAHSRIDQYMRGK